MHFHLTFLVFKRVYRHQNEIYLERPSQKQFRTIFVITSENYCYDALLAINGVIGNDAINIVYKILYHWKVREQEAYMLRREGHRNQSWWLREWEIVMLSRLSSTVRPIVSSNMFSVPFNVIQVAQFSKYISKSRTKRLALTTKRAGKGYYKGNRCRREGTHTSKGCFSIEHVYSCIFIILWKFENIGGFIMNKELITELVVPDLTGFKLKAYVAYGAKRNIIDANVQVQVWCLVYNTKKC